MGDRLVVKNTYNLSVLNEIMQFCVFTCTGKDYYHLHSNNVSRAGIVFVIVYLYVLSVNSILLSRLI